MKRIITFIMLLTMLVSSTMVSNASNNKESKAKIKNQVVINFNENKYKNMSDKQKGIAKLKDSGYTEEVISKMPKKTIERIASATSAVQTTSYHKEMMPDVSKNSKDNEGAELVKISKKEFYDITHQIPSPKDVPVVDKAGKPIEEQKDISIRSLDKDVDSGTVKLTTTMYTYGTSDSHYLVVSHFQWTTMPSFRGEDIFGITRGEYKLFCVNG